MGKWLAGIIATIIAGVGVAYFSALLVPRGNDTPQPPSQPSPEPVPSREVVGYLVLSSGISRPNQLTSDDSVCTITRSDENLARTVPDLAQSRFLSVSSAELYAAFQTGVCTVVFFEERSVAQSRLPGSTPIRITAH